MAANPLLSLQTRAIDLSGAGEAVARNIQFDRQQEQQQEQIDLQKQQIDQQANKDREESTLIAASVLDTFLEKGDIEGAKTYLKSRGKNLIDIGKNPNDTFEGLEMLEQNPEQLRQITSAARQEAQMRGLIEPSSQGGFTLSEGQTRFDAMGNPIADVPEGGGEQTRDLTPDEVKEAGFPEGSIVQRKPNNDLVVRFTPDADRGGDQRDREIADLADDLKSQGVPDPNQKATRIVDGRARIEVSEDGQRAVFVDEVALAAGEENAVHEIQLREPEDPGRAEIEPADSLFAMAEKATGPQATIRSVTARIPFTNVSESERETVTARRAFELTENELARGLVNNPRFPVREREAVINAINISPSVFDNPDAMKARLSAARDFLTSRLAQAQRDAKDETLPEDTRKDQASNASAMRNALDRIGKPAEETASTMRQISELGPESAEFVISDMPREQLREMINNASDEELGGLSVEVSNMIRDRLRGQ